MIRPATRADLPRILEIRDSVGENRLTNPAALTKTGVAQFIDNGTLWVWQEDQFVTGLVAVHLGDGFITALFVATGYEGKGFGRTLLNWACDMLRDAGHRVATLATNHRAARHYLAAGWTIMRKDARGELVFQKVLNLD